MRAAICQEAHLLGTKDRALRESLQSRQQGSPWPSLWPARSNAWPVSGRLGSLAEDKGVSLDCSPRVEISYYLPDDR